MNFPTKRLHSVTKPYAAMAAVNVSSAGTALCRCHGASSAQTATGSGAGYGVDASRRIYVIPTQLREPQQGGSRRYVFGGYGGKDYSFLLRMPTPAAARPERPEASTADADFQQPRRSTGPPNSLRAFPSETSPVA